MPSPDNLGIGGVIICAAEGWVETTLSPPVGVVVREGLSAESLFSCAWAASRASLSSLSFRSSLSKSSSSKERLQHDVQQPALLVLEPEPHRSVVRKQRMRSFSVTSSRRGCDTH